MAHAIRKSPYDSDGDDPFQNFPSNRRAREDHELEDTGDYKLHSNAPGSLNQADD